MTIASKPPKSKKVSIRFTDGERRVFQRWLAKKRCAEGELLPTLSDGQINFSGMRLTSTESRTLWYWIRRKRLAKGEDFPSLPTNDPDRRGGEVQPDIQGPQGKAPIVALATDGDAGVISDFEPANGSSPPPRSHPTFMPDFAKLNRQREKFYGVKHQRKYKSKPDPIADILKERWSSNRELGQGPKRRRHGSREQKYTYIERTYAAGWKEIEKDMLANPEDPKVLKFFANLLDSACHRLKSEGCPEAVLPDKMRSEWAIVCTWLLVRNTQPREVYTRIKLEGGTEKIRRQAAKTQKSQMPQT